MSKVTEDYGHWSDCALHNAPAFPAEPCDCGGLDLAAYDRYRAVTGFIPTPWGLARFIEDGELPRSVHSEDAPGNGIPAVAAASDLPTTHNGIPGGAGAYRVDLNNTSEPTVGNRKAFTGSQSVTSDVPPHAISPDSSSDDSTGRQ